MADLEIIGMLAGGLVAAGFVPQVFRVWKLKSAREISLLFTLLFLAGGVLWITYGFLFSSVPVIVWNVINVVLLSTLLVAKLRYGLNTKRPT